MDKTQRMFVALFPSSPVVSKLIHGIALEHARQVGGRIVPALNLHITLKFLGNIDHQTQTCIEAELDRPWPQLPDLEMRALEYRAQQRMLWLRADQSPELLGRMTDRIEELSVACGAAAGSYSFIPHITLVRNTQQSMASQAAISPISMKFDEIALVHSETLPEGSRYTIVRRFALK